MTGDFDKIFNLLSQDNDNNGDKSTDETLAELAQTQMIDETLSGRYIGMMSGTSLDGLDVVICQFDDDKPMQLLASHTEPFDDKLKQVLLALTHPDKTNELAQDVKAYLIDSFARLSNDTVNQRGETLISEMDFFGAVSVVYAGLCAKAVHAVLQKAKLSAYDITAIGVHGQTVRHRPEFGFSLQLLDANSLAEQSGISVVSDFRRRDMAVGGQGAPLVPAFHADIFGLSENGGKVVLNLGGIANITVLTSPVIGYDTGVANLLMDAWAWRCLGVAYDKGGAWAKSGQVHQPLLDKLLSHPFLQQTAPKSTGREEFNLTYLENILADNGFDVLKNEDVQATLCEFTAVTAATEIAKYANQANANQGDTLYVCGGGAYNVYLLDRLRHHLPQWTVTTTDELGLNPTWVEASCFAWLARQSLLGRAGNLPSVTGASRAVVLGQVCFA